MVLEFADVGRGVRLCYETFGERDAPNGVALLVMGLGRSASRSLKISLAKSWENEDESREIV